MDAGKVVTEKMKRHRVSAVFHHLAERVRQSRYSSRMHPHIEIVPLRIGRADVRHVRIALNRGLDSASAFGRVVVAPALRGRSVKLHKHGIVATTPDFAPSAGTGHEQRAYPKA